MALNRGNFGEGLEPGSTTVTTSTTEIVPANNSRNFIYLTNVGANDVFIAFDKPAQINKGVLLGSNNGSLTLDKESNVLGPINGITASGSSAVIFQEAI